MFNRITKWTEDHPWVFLVAAGWFAVEAVNSFRAYQALVLIRETTDFVKDAADV